MYPSDILAQFELRAPRDVVGDDWEDFVVAEKRLFRKLLWTPRTLSPKHGMQLRAIWDAVLPEVEFIPNPAHCLCS